MTEDSLFSERIKSVLALLHAGVQEATKSRGLSNQDLSGIFPYISYLADRKIDSIYYLLCKPDAPEQRAYNYIWALQRAALIELLDKLACEGIYAAVFKGAEFVWCYFKESALNISNDVDLLVPRDQIGITKKVLFGLGYRQADIDKATGSLQDVDVAEIAAFESKHYELYAFKKLVTIDFSIDELNAVKNLDGRVAWVSNEKCTVLIEIDIHFKVALDIPAEPFFEYAVPSSLGHGLTFSSTDHLWFTTSRYYHEVALHGKSILRDFVFLSALLRDPSIDWNRFIRTAEIYQLQPSLYYFLSFADQFVRAMPLDVHIALKPKIGSRNRDWGWQLGKLLDFVEPFPLTIEYGVRELR